MAGAYLTSQELPEIFNIAVRVGEYRSSRTAELSMQLDSESIDELDEWARFLNADISLEEWPNAKTRVFVRTVFMGVDVDVWTLIPTERPRQASGRAAAVHKAIAQNEVLPQDPSPAGHTQALPPLPDRDPSIGKLSQPVSEFGPAGPPRCPSCSGPIAYDRDAARWQHVLYTECQDLVTSREYTTGATL